MKTKVFGIDLGTTNTCVALYENRSFKVLPIEGEKLVPSVVAWDGQKLITGQKALSHSKLYPMQSIRSVKRLMNGPHQEILLTPDLFLTPLKVSAKILSYLKEKVQEEYELEVEDVVITVPAYFNDTERRATLQAGEMAGLNVLRIINEPTAAALVCEAGELDRRSNVNSKKNEEKWVVYDLGGGTFDVTVLSVKNNVKEVLASEGDVHLGGDDFDHKIVDWLLEYLICEHGIDVRINAGNNASIDSGADKKGYDLLLHLAEKLKLSLSSETEVEIQEEFFWESQLYPIRTLLTREIFEFLIRDDVDKTLRKTREALLQANCRSREIDRVILVGGSSKIPLIREILQKEFGTEAITFIDADCSVALGAGIQAAICSALEFDHVIIDVASHSLGLACLGEEDYGGPNLGGQECLDFVERLRSRHAQTFSPLIRKNTRLPAKFIEIFYTATDNQTEVEIPIYQGESPRVRENSFIGSFMAKIQPGPEGTQVKVGLEYDLNGLIQVSVQQDGQRQAQYFTINLKQSVEENIDQACLYFLETGYAGSPFQDNLGGTVEGFERPHGPQGPQGDEQISNYLIQRVEMVLEQIDLDAEPKRFHLSQLLEEYKSILKNLGQGESVDEMADEKLEERLDEIEDLFYVQLEEGEM